MRGNDLSVSLAAASSPGRGAKGNDLSVSLTAASSPGRGAEGNDLSVSLAAASSPGRGAEGAGFGAAALPPLSGEVPTQSAERSFLPSVTLCS